MKKIIITLLILPLIVLTGFFGYRYQNNVTSVSPYPYVFEKSAYSELETEAPILIVGDRMGVRLASFSKQMAERISVNLNKPIQIETMAAKGEGLHRTLRKLKSLKRLPLIVIYLGGSEETIESKFKTEDIPVIKRNLALYNDDRIQTLLMIFPALSRFVYHPVNYRSLSSSPEEAKADYDQTTILKRNEISFKLFEQEINELFTYAKDRNSYMIAVLTPINLDIPPKKSCEGSLPSVLEPKLKKAQELAKRKDFKQAYNITRELALLANSSAQALYFHGQVSKKIGNISEAQKHLELAAAYDCENWRGTPIYNTILKQAAERHDIAFFDLNKMVKDHWTRNVVFFDEIYPQNLYMEKMADAIAVKIKKLLKL